MNKSEGRPVKTSNSLVSVIMSMSCGLNTASLDHQRWVGEPPVIGGGTGRLRCLRAQFLNIPHPDHHHLPTSYTQKLHSFDSTHRDDSDEQILSEANRTQNVNSLLELQLLKVMAGSYLLIMFRYIEDFSATMGIPVRSRELLYIPRNSKEHSKRALRIENSFRPLQEH